MLIISIILSGFVVFLTGIYWYQTRSRYAKLLNSFPPVPMFIPVIGNVFCVSQKPNILFQQIRKIIGEYKETFYAWGGIYGTLHIVTADDAEIILSNIKHIDKGLIYELFHSWLGTGLLTSTGAKWHQRRKMLTPAFHYNILQMFIETFGKKSEKLIETLKDQSMKPIDVSNIIKESTMEVICETSMGNSSDLNNNLQKSYYEALQNVGELLVKRVLSPWLHPDLAYYTTPSYWREKKLLKFLHKFTNEIIVERQKTFQNSDVADLESTTTKPKKNVAMLDLLLYAKNLGLIDDEGIREEVDTFVFEGHDTTAVGISNILLQLAQHPGIQQKIILELDEIFGKSSRHPSYEDLQNMKYLECCIKEALRLYPSVPFIIRNIKEDVPLTKHTAPAGTEVFIHIYNVHRDPTYFPDPEKFDPDRFLPENSVGRHPYAYIPFSAGPRNCLGQKFAMLELKSIISSVMRNFTLDAVDKLEDLNWIVHLVLKVDGPMRVKFIPRS